MRAVRVSCHAARVAKAGSVTLLGTLLLVFVALPLIHHGQKALAGLIFLAAFAVGLHSISEHRRQLVIGFSLMAPAILFAIIRPFVGEVDAIKFLGLASYTLAFGFLLWVMVRRLFRTRSVTIDTITTAMTGYVLIGIFWAFLYAIVLLLQPGCIRGLEATQEADDLFYFSFVTMTTLGYGDMAPVTALARVVAAMEAVVGQLYIAVTIARLVGLHIAAGIAAGMGDDVSSS